MKGITWKLDEETDRRLKARGEYGVDTHASIVKKVLDKLEEYERKEAEEKLFLVEEQPAPE